MIVENNYYKELLKLKSEGKLFAFEEITHEQLEKLWWHEMCSDNEIGELFDINGKSVYYRRNKMNIKQRNYENEKKDEDFLELHALAIKQFAVGIIINANKNKDEKIEVIVENELKKHFGAKYEELV